jgi:DNA-directed RNA polymerase specialized sigma24 family protein
MDESSSGAVPRDDAQLISAIASGDAAAYAQLHERHVAAARRLAGLLVRDNGRAEEVLSETFTRLHRVLRDGGGPKAALRPYLLTAVRRVAAERKAGPGPDAARAEAAPTEAAGTEEASAEAARTEAARTEAARTEAAGLEAAATEPPRTVASAAPEPDLGDPLSVDPSVADLAESRLGRAFASLPGRQRAALWHVVIEGADPADAAAPLGVTADGVADLAGQASAALIQAYLARYASGLAREDCRDAVSALGGGADGSLRGLDEPAAAPHMRACRDCRAAAIELADLGRSLRQTVAPIYLGGAATAYLAGSGPEAGPSAGRAGWAAGLAASWQRWLRQAPRQQHALAGGGLLLAAVVVAGLALVLGTGNGPPGPAAQHPVSAAAGPPSPPPATTQPPPVPGRHRARGPAAPKRTGPAKTVSTTKPAGPTPAPSPTPSPSASPTPSPTPPVVNPSPPPHRRHHHPPP